MDQNRKTNLCRHRIEQALKELLQDKDYCDISVTELIEKADVGKTTFYRHYDRKLDVFVALHNSLFELLLQDLTTQADWLSQSVAPSTALMFNRMQGQGNFRRSMSYKLGKDAPQAFRQIKQNLADTIETRLSTLFDVDSFIIPINSIASTLAAVYLDFISQLLSDNQPAANEKANSLQRIVRACIKAAMAE